jgi:hypothetical protein
MWNTEAVDALTNLRNAWLERSVVHKCRVQYCTGRWQLHKSLEAMSRINVTIKEVTLRYRIARNESALMRRLAAPTDEEIEKELQGQEARAGGCNMGDIRGYTRETP